MTNQNLFAEMALALKKAEAAMKVASIKFDQVCESLGYSEDDVETMTRDLERNTEEDIYGVFNGQNMVDEQGNIYPIPQNYASKSKLVTGDQLKMTRGGENQSYLFKQIKNIDRKVLDGVLTLDGSNYQVVTKDNVYNVLYASVTFFRIKIGDKVTILVPESLEANWAAIDNVIPN